MAKRSSESDLSLFDLPLTESAEADGPPPPPSVPRGGTPPSGDTGVPLHEAARARYLNYALSVITARALPDVRDGLKPVQRRILYTMWQQNLRADAKHRKSATVVGAVLGNYHPHGDSSVYDALVRMAQPFSLRYPLVDGSGNFGSLDGDAAAAYRYTEARLARLADELLIELEQDTVAERPNFDGTKSEPVVLPARIPNLLVNGSTGIAVGMATNIPPHNLGEICTALLKLLDNDELTSVQLCKWVKGPDFPTGGQILNSPEELKEIYKTGTGAIRLRATWKLGESSRASKTVIITSIPYTVDKSELVQRIGDITLSRKLPPLVDVRDVSTDDVRIELELKRDADEKMVMAYLFKHTPLQTNFNVNLTCLIPTENPEVGRPERLDLKAMLWHFLHFRLDVVTRRLEYERAALARRMHLLEGFAKVFDALDEILRIVRKSEGKQDAAAQIMKRFELDAEQTDAILELKIYRLARLEILVIQQELDAARRRSRELVAALKDEAKRWALVRSEIEAIRTADPALARDARRTIMAGDDGEVEYLGRGLHRRGGHDRDRVARRLGEAPERGEGSFRDAAARRRRGARRRGGQHAGDRGVLHQLRHGLHLSARGHPCVDRIRRADSEPLQVPRRRACDCGARLRPAPREGTDRRRARCAAAHTRHRGDERWLQPALRIGSVRRAEHARRPTLRQGGRRGGGGGGRADHRY